MEAAENDERFQELWEARNSSDDKQKRLEALEELGILSVDQQGNWKYSNAFMAWIFET